MSYFKSKEFFDSAIALLKNKWLPFVLGMPLFFCLHHYEGIVNDARLYLLQVIHGWFPERFVNDPPFMFGNQDSYGLFTPFYRFVLSFLPVDQSAFFMTFLAQVLWAGGLFFFIYCFCKRVGLRLWFTPLVFAFILYSGDKMPNDHIFFFQFIENFNCSRLFSLAIGLWGLGALLIERKYISSFLFLLGTLVHPLTAGWCLPLWLFFFYPKTRVPIAVVSLLLPLTFMLRKGVFDIYPEDWGICTHDHPITFLMLWRQMLGVLFFGIVMPRFVSNNNILTISRSVFWILLIGLYWSLLGGLPKHILIYQVQVWRIEWLIFILALPFFAYIIYEQIQLFRHKCIDGINTHIVSLVLFGYALFMPAPCTGAVIVATTLLFFPRKQLNMLSAMLILSAFCIFSAGVQEFTQAMLVGAFNVSFIGVSDLFKEVDNLVFLEFLLAFAIFIVTLYKIIKERTEVLLLSGVLIALLVFITFPQFQLLPVALTIVILFFKKKIGLPLLVVTLLLCIGDSFFATGMRNVNVFAGLPWQTLDALVFVTPFFVVLALLLFIVSNTLKKMSLFVAFTVLSVLAYGNYDQREESLKISESNLELFRNHSIFPQIKNRGKMFYYVKGDYVDEPRTQFLTGSYFSETTPIGEALFQGQFNEERKRLNYIFFKEQRGYIAERGDWQNFVKDSLSNKNVLLDRVTFLCSIDEITHFVSNLRVKELEKQDSYKIRENETIYLYGCPNDKN